MRVALVCLVHLLISHHDALAQRHYTFEEACRNAGWTTGACAPKSRQPTSPLCVNTVGKAFHAAEVQGFDKCLDTVLADVADSEVFVEMIGIPNIARINELKLTIRHSTGYGGAMALFQDQGRMIIYDPLWARTVSAEAYLVLGHEAGHHFCGHTLPGFQGKPKADELEADRFAGASIRRFETYHGKQFLPSALVAAAKLYSVDGNRTHPRREDRINAIVAGYQHGSPCGNFSPGTPGYSPNPR